MKKVLFILAAACMAFASCSNDAETGTPAEGTAFVKGQKVTLSVSAGDNVTRVTGTDNGTQIDFKWEANDQIQVTVGSETATFTLASGEGTASATFSGIMPASGTSFDIQYPTDAVDVDLSTQAYTAGKVPAKKMSFSATGCTLGTVAALTADFSVLQLNFTGTDAISKVVVETVDVTPAKSYTLSIKNGVTLSATAKAFYVVTDKMNEKLKVTVYNNAPAEICNFTTTDKIDLSTGNCVNMPAKKIVLLSGEFSVSGTKKVKFTKGNLYWDGNNFHIEDSQTAYPNSWNTNYVGHFFWTKKAVNSYVENNPEGTPSINDHFFADGSDAGHTLTVDSQNGLYVLSSTEWSYLLNSRTFNSASGEGKSYQRATVNSDATGIYGLIIYPDGYTAQTSETSYDSDQWSTMESAGCVFLPAACRYRNGNSVVGAGSYGGYLSATLCENNLECMYGLRFKSDEFNPAFQYSRGFGFSVRLVVSK